MKLLNHTLVYLAGSLLLIIGIWAAVFYFSMLDEVYDSLDDGLDNYKMLIIQKADTDTTILHKTSFDESNYLIREIPNAQAMRIHDTYSDTLMFMQNEKKHEPVRLLTTAFKHGDKYYMLKVISSMVEEDDLIEHMLYALVFLYLIILLSVVLINNILLRRIWRPFYQLISQLRQFNLKSDTGFTVPETRVQEFKVLNEAAQTLLSKNLEIYNSQKEFIENAAHELQTPIAISMNKIELMMEESDMSDAQLQTLSDVSRNLERLARLNTSLLLISKIENRQFAETEMLSLNELVSQQAGDFATMLEFKDIRLNFRQPGKFVHAMNKDLAVVLITNLLKNAIVHNIAGGEIQVVAHDNTLSISNTGIAESLDSKKIFTRFYRASAKKNSTGLGLSIIKAIAARYKLQVVYTYAGGHHTMTLKK